MAVRSRRLCRRLVWTNARWPVGVIEQGSIGSRVHQAVVQQGHLDLVHVQADEIRVKGCKMIAWMALAMMVPTRLWLGGVVSLTRDRSLADRLLVPPYVHCSAFVRPKIVARRQLFPRRATLFSSLQGGEMCGKVNRVRLQERWERDRNADEQVCIGK